MTLTPELPTVADTVTAAAIDEVLHGRNLRSAHVIAGILDAGLLNHAGRPDKLPTALFPDVDPDAVQAIWNMALTVGIWAGKAMLRPQWRPEELDRFQRALAEAGHHAMASSVTIAAQCGRRSHPADEDLLLWGDHE
ncbi:hypothetical protein AB0B07_33450 [Streptomyces sioyaensis]|uniref:hypothetical protein n=1 Tax=Streptomyces sioyaensis TaxID=67364 RepID=UPI00340D7C83